MSKVAQYLQDHLKGEVSVAPATRQHFASDASTLRQVPQVVVSPVDEQDVRKVTRFAWQLAEKGRVLPIVARGAGTDLGGAALGQTLVLAFQPHMNKTLEFDDRKGTVVVEPGANFGRLQHMLSFSHRRYIPAYPNSYEYVSIGGAIANNSGGERSIQFGPLMNYVESLRVVLANGEVINTGRLSKKEVSKRMGLPTFEGEIYRALDALLNENEEIIAGLEGLGRSQTGYALGQVRARDGSVDLTPLFVGAQGTLGIIVQALLRTEPYTPESTILVMSLQDREALTILQHELMNEKPLSLEYVDRSVLELARRTHKGLMDKEVGGDLPAGLVVAEFTTLNKRALGKLMKKIDKKCGQFGVTILEPGESTEAAAARLKRLPQVLMSQRFLSSQLVPGIDDASVPPASLHDFLTAAEGLFKKSGLTVITHARLGEGLVHAYPLVDLGQLGDRQRLFRLSDEYYKLVLASGGSVVGEHGDGRIRAGFAKQQLGDALYEVMVKLKVIFDPYGIFNPGVKINVDTKAAFALLRQEYEVSQLYHY